MMAGENFKEGKAKAVKWVRGMFLKENRERWRTEKR